MVEIKIKTIEKIKNVLISVADKEGIKRLVTCLFFVNPCVQFFTTKSNYDFLKRIFLSEGFSLDNLSFVDRLRCSEDGKFIISGRKFIDKDIQDSYEINFDVLIINLFIAGDLSIIAQGSSCAQLTCNKDLDILNLIHSTVKKSNTLVLCEIDQYTNFCKKLKESGGKCMDNCILEAMEISKGLAEIYDREITSFLKKMSSEFEEANSFGNL